MDSQPALLCKALASGVPVLQIALPRRVDVDYSMEHWHGHVFLTMRTTDTPNSRLLIAPLDDLSRQRELRPHRADTQLEDVSVSARHVALLERANGLSECHVFSLPSSAEASTVRSAGSAGVRASGGGLQPAPEECACVSCHHGELL